jgi:hypothetical protein
VTLFASAPGEPLSSSNPRDDIMIDRTSSVVFAFLAALGLGACAGPQGPTGAQGLTGRTGQTGVDTVIVSPAHPKTVTAVDTVIVAPVRPARSAYFSDDTYYYR